MKLISFEHLGQHCVGAIENGLIYSAGQDYIGPDGMLLFLKNGQSAQAALRAEIEKENSNLDVEDIKILAPVRRPPKYFGVALNYSDHIAETGLEKPEYPTLFNKQSTCSIGPDDAIVRPTISEKLDYEGELGVVIGQFCRHVSYEDAKDMIAGYTIVNDVSVRDWQTRSHTWTLGKSFDTHGPHGPWIVTPDELGDPHQLNIKTWVNDEKRQDFSTRHLIFDCYYLVEYLSKVMTLEPGDIIATGTSSGVGVKMKPRGYMKPGDTVTIEIEKIGKLSNPVIQE